MSSLYIPRVHTKCHLKHGTKRFASLAEFMTHVFHTMDLGVVARVDLAPIPGPDGKQSNFSKAFIHFERWYTTANALAIQEEIVKSELPNSTVSVRLLYDPPHYWILKPNKSRVNKDNSKISNLEKQIQELNIQLSSCSERLASATQQLSSIECFSETSEEIPYKRKRIPN